MTVMSTDKQDTWHSIISWLSSSLSRYLTDFIQWNIWGFPNLTFKSSKSFFPCFLCKLVSGYSKAIILTCTYEVWSWNYECLIKNNCYSKRHVEINLPQNISPPIDHTFSIIFATLWSSSGSPLSSMSFLGGLGFLNGLKTSQ